MREVIIPAHVWPVIVEAWFNFLLQQHVLAIVKRSPAEEGYDCFVLSGRWVNGGEEVMFVREKAEKDRWYCSHTPKGILRKKEEEKKHDI